MHKNYSLLILIAYIGFCNLSCSKIHFLHEGVIKQHRYFVNFDSNAQLPMPDNLESKIWFQDSCVIYEVKVVHINTNYSGNDTIRAESYDLYKYTYLNLHTLSCQDYYHLSDTALPFSNYFLKSNEGIGWSFYEAKKVTDLSGEKSSLPDTIIEGKMCKRIKYTNNNNSDGYEYVYYLDCNVLNNIFHINRSLDELNPGCKVIRSELRGDLNSPLKMIFDVNILSDKLTPKERKIFKKWGENASSTKLPLLTYREVKKKYLPPPKYIK